MCHFVSIYCKFDFFSLVRRKKIEREDISAAKGKLFHKDSTKILVPIEKKIQNTTINSNSKSYVVASIIIIIVIWTRTKLK